MREMVVQEILQFGYTNNSSHSKHTCEKTIQKNTLS
jgi:hypothetical protein